MYSTAFMAEGHLLVDYVWEKNVRCVCRKRNNTPNMIWSSQADCGTNRNAIMFNNKAVRRPPCLAAHFDLASANSECATTAVLLQVCAASGGLSWVVNTSRCLIYVNFQAVLESLCCTA